MKPLTPSFLLFALVIMALAIHVAKSEEEALINDNDDDTTDQEPFSSSLRGASRLLVQKMTCDKYPRVCRVSGSPGRNCCKKKCVNVSTDRLNCGKCGKKCKYSEICCKGKCVNPMSDRKNCGGCNNKCKKGSKCTYGMCSYA